MYLTHDPCYTLLFMIGLALTCNLFTTIRQSILRDTRTAFSLPPGIGRLKDRQRSKIEILFWNFQKSCFAHDTFNFTNEAILTSMTSSVTSKRGFEYCPRPLYSCVRDDGMFYGHYLGKQFENHNHISRLHITEVYLTENTFQDRRSKVKITGSPGELGILTDVAPSFLEYQDETKIKM